jgi:hypothetical protein
MHCRYLAHGLRLTLLLAVALHTAAEAAEAADCQRSGTGVAIFATPVPEGDTAYSDDALKLTLQLTDGVRLNRVKVEANGMSTLDFTGQQLVPDFNGELTLRAPYIVGADESGKIRLQPGLNQLRVEAWDSNTPSRCTVKDEIGVKALNAENYAVLVGINNYAAINKPLKHARNDAEQMAWHLMAHNGVPKRNITLLTDKWEGAGADPFNGRRQLATERNIQLALSGLADTVDRRGTVIFYYSGHGFAPRPHSRGFLESHYLMASDSIPQAGQADVTLIPFITIAKRLNKIAAKNKLVILDACFSSAVVASRGDSDTPWRPKTLGPTSSINGAVALLSSDDNVYLMSSSTEDQQSYEFDDVGHSIFTYHLLRGSATPDTMPADASVQEAFMYAKNAVLKAVPERISGKAQEPKQWSVSPIDTMIWRRRNTATLSAAP